MEDLRLKHITFTGVDAKTDINHLQEIQKKYPIAEFGVLTSYHWDENGNRYLDPKLIERLERYNLNLSLHICGTAAHDAAIGNWEKVDFFVKDMLHIFGRVQLNVSTQRNNPKYVHVPLVIGQEVIIQTKDVNDTSLFQNTLDKWYYPSYKWSMLLDASGGRGIDTGIGIFKSLNKIGYAGGINPDNVADKLRFLLENVDMGEFWIDMESGVRTDDWFDLDKVENVLKTCEKVINEFRRNSYDKEIFRINGT